MLCIYNLKKRFQKHSGTAKHRKAHTAKAAMGNIIDIMLGEKSRIFVRTLLQTIIMAGMAYLPTLTNFP